MSFSRRGDGCEHSARLVHVLLLDTGVPEFEPPSANTQQHLAERRCELDDEVLRATLRLIRKWIGLRRPRGMWYCRERVALRLKARLKKYTNRIFVYQLPTYLSAVSLRVS